MANRVTRNHRRDGIQFGANGYISLADNEIDVSSGDLTLDVAGDIKLDANGNTINFADGSQIGVTWELTSGTATRLRMYEDGGDSAFDFFTIDVATNGETTISTTDAAAAAGHLTIAPDGGLNLSPGAHVNIPSQTRLFFDGGTDTYIRESSADVLTFTCRATTILTLVGSAAGNDVTLGGLTDLTIQGGQKLWLDGQAGGAGDDTFIYEHGDDDLRFVVGNDGLMKMVEAGSAGNKIDFITSGAGFTQGVPTYDATATQVFFNRLGNKQFLTFDGGNIVDLKLYFPDVSCNCLLVVKQDGTGSRLIGDYLAFDSSGNAANGGSQVFWAGGSEPTLTTAGNAIDIISFYWDNTTEIAYATISQAFAAP